METDVGRDDGAMRPGGSPYVAPRLTLRVAVTGHRPNKLENVDLDRLAERSRAVLGCLAAVARNLQAANDANPGGMLAAGAPKLRLVTQIAEGADRIVTRAAIDLDYSLNLILPFPRARYAEDFDGEALKEFNQFCAHKAVESCTELDVSDTAQNLTGYRAAGHVMLSHCDVLLAIWDQQSGAGPGGTADVIDEAIRRGLLVVLITLDGKTKLWTVPEAAHDPLKEGEWKSIVVEADDCSNEMAERMRDLFTLKGTAPDASRHTQEHAGEHAAPTASAIDRLSDFRGETVSRSALGFGYELLRKVFLPGRRFSWPIDLGLQLERQEAWKATRQTAAATGGDAFRRDIDTRLRDRWIGADNLAIQYAHRFRTAFVTNFTLAAVAVFVGLLALFMIENTEAKAILVAVELVLIGTILWNTWRGRTRRWRDRWLDYRRLAEALRSARLPILVGSSPARASTDVFSAPGHEWPAWYLRMALREIAPPHGVLNKTALRSGIDIAIDEEINGQIKYHQVNARASRDLDHRLELTAEIALWVTIASGLLYLALFVFSSNHDVKEWLHHYKPVATFLGGTLPVVGAAIFGIRATADFRTAMRQSERMVVELEHMRRILTAARETPELIRVEQLLGQLSRTLSEDQRVWAMVYSERELTSGF